MAQDTGRLIMVCGCTGAGKTTYSLALAAELKAVRFSIDPWMQTLFGPDMEELDYDWMIARVLRCYDQIWDVAAQILQTGGTAILDLGFTERQQRDMFYRRARDIGVEAELHFLDVATDIRQQRVQQRNTEKDPAVYMFEVTDFMFDFMETRFEHPSSDEPVLLVTN